MLRRLSSAQQQKPIVKRADVRDAKQKMASDFEGTRYLVKYPENFFGVFKHLIGDNQIRLTVFQWQPIPLDVHHTNLVGLSCQTLRILQSTFHRDQSRLWMESSDYSQVSSSASPKIDHNIKITQRADKFFDHVWTIGFQVIDK